MKDDKKTKRQLIEEIDQLRHLYKFPSENPNPVLRVSADGVILYANSGSAYLLDFWHTIPGEVAPESIRKLIQDALTNDSSLNADIDCDGIWYSLAIVPISEGRYVNIYGMDITERKEAETAVRHAKEEWEHTFASVPDLIAILDNHYRVVRANRAMADRLGCTPEEFVGLPCYKVVHGTDAPPAFCPHSATLVDGCEHTAELHEDRIGGDFLVSTTPLRDDEGRMIGSVHVARDITIIKQAEKTLAIERDRLNTIMENTQAGLALLDRKFNFIAVNSVYIGSLNSGVEDIIGKNYFDLFPESEDRRILEHVRRSGEEMTIRDKCSKYPGHPEQAVVYADWTLVPIKDKRGRTESLVLSITDTTERVLAQQRLRRNLQRKAEESQALYQLLADNVTDVILVMDAHLRFTYVSPSVLALSGYTSDEILGQSLKKVLTTDSSKAVIKTLKEILDQELPAVRDGAMAEFNKTIELEVTRKDGSTVWTETNVKLLLGPSEDMFVLIGVSRDISLRKEAQQALERSQKSLSDAQRIAHLGNWEWNINTGELIWSDEVYRMFGLGIAEIEPTYETFLEFVHYNDRVRVQTAVNRAVRGKEEYSIDHRIVRPDESERVVHEQGEVFYDDFGKPVRMVGTVHDITEIKENEQKLRALSRRLMEVQEEAWQRIGRELHDQIGQTVTVLRLLIDRAFQSDEQEVRHILAQASALTSELVTGIRNMSSELRPRILDDLGLLPALVWQAKRISEQTPVQIDFKYFNLAQRFPPEIATAAYRIAQEALTNAVRHAKVDRVDLRAWADHGELTLLIEDHGVGFNPMDLPTGFSCGLSGIEERASLLGGEMILETSPGGGTRISITLPLNQQYTKVEM